MLDFYEGEALRRTILIRNAMRRTEAITQEAQRRQQRYDRKRSNLSQADAELFYGDMNSTTDEAEQVSHARQTAPVRVQVTDYDYEIEDEPIQKLHNTTTEDDEYEDSTEDEDEGDETSDEDDDVMLARHGHVRESDVRVSVTSVVKDEHTWFDDLLDEVSIDEAKPRSYIQRVHPSDHEMEDEEEQNISASISSLESSIGSLSLHQDSAPTSANSASSLPSLVEDEDESSGGSSAEEEELEDAFSQHYTNRFGKAVNYSGGAELSTTNTKNHQSFMQPTETYLDW